ncbi:hypothetical protein K505DRAFT_366440 [Melanomma pulvis-pyrius CBS 109.77]|uniref:RRM domain-containing protein n=1 Tax=Melanomma pulvis-pyrius CBS 109.77 TaxID=1314802 RepID=A0A6A6WX17_9PLEO|nr:hypothetical protein K505DRAFT_366440 [Melanomma pulvis-pyrius CBS 109.77]
MADNTSFADFVKESRERKKKEALAQEILGSRGRKANGSGAGAGAPTARNASQKPTLLSRISGVNKPRSSSAKPTVGGSIDGKWQHDLHKLNNPGGAPAKAFNRTASASQLDRNTRTFDKFRSAIQNNTRNNAAPAIRDEGPGFSIRGVATGGPFTVVGSNFAPGTTAADVMSAMAPYGEILSCKLMSATPTVVIEIVFNSRESADTVIATFNNQKADGRVLYVYLKNALNTPNTAIAHSRPAPRAMQSSFDDMDLDTNGGARSGSFQDGRFGFSENNQREPPRGPRRRY